MVWAVPVDDPSAPPVEMSIAEMAGNNCLAMRECGLGRQLV